MGLLTTIILIPFLAVIVIGLLPEKQTAWIKRTALLATAINLGLSIYLCLDYLGKIGWSGANPNTGAGLSLSYEERFTWLGKLGIQYYLGVEDRKSVV